MGILNTGDIIEQMQRDRTESQSKVTQLEGSEYDIDIVSEVLSNPNQLGTIVNGKTKHFYSNGAFNLIQLTLYVLKQTGPANVFISTYSIAEDSITALRKQYDIGNIKDIRFLIDNRVRTISPKPFEHLVKAFPGCYRCTALHAKVVCISNKDWHISIVGSQNATHNPKLERGIIHTDPSVWMFDVKNLQHVFNSGTE